MIKVSLSEENEMKDSSVDNEVGNLFHLECLDAAFSRFHLTACANVGMSKANARLVQNVEYAAAGCVDAGDECWSCWHIDSVMSAPHPRPLTTRHTPGAPGRHKPHTELETISSVSIITDNITMWQKPFRHLRGVTQHCVNFLSRCLPSVPHYVHSAPCSRLIISRSQTLAQWRRALRSSETRTESDTAKWGASKPDIMRRMQT